MNSRIQELIEKGVSREDAEANQRSAIQQGGDLNGDGMVTDQEWAQHTSKGSSAAAPAKPSSQPQQKASAYAQQWKQNQIDSGRFADEAAFNQHMQHAKKGDINGDGIVTDQEWKYASQNNFDLTKGRESMVQALSDLQRQSTNGVKDVNQLTNREKPIWARGNNDMTRAQGLAQTLYGSGKEGMMRYHEEVVVPNTTQQYHDINDKWSGKTISQGRPGTSMMGMSIGTFNDQGLVHYDPRNPIYGGARRDQYEMFGLGVGDEVIQGNDGQAKAITQEAWDRGLNAIDHIGIQNGVVETGIENDEQRWRREKLGLPAPSSNIQNTTRSQAKETAQSYQASPGKSDYQAKSSDGGSESASDRSYSSQRAIQNLQNRNNKFQNPEGASSDFEMSSTINRRNNTNSDYKVNVQSKKYSDY